MIETQDLDRQLKRLAGIEHAPDLCTQSSADASSEGLLQCTKNAEIYTRDDDHVHEINMAGCLE